MAENENLTVNSVEPDSLQERVITAIRAQMAPLEERYSGLQKSLSDAVDNDARPSEVRPIRDEIRAFNASGELLDLKMRLGAVAKEKGGVSKIPGVRSVTEQVAEAMGIE